MAVENKINIEISVVPSEKLKSENKKDDGAANTDDEPADFEKAIVAAKWGKFHIILYLLSITSGWSSMFETTTMSYVFPVAECDLNLRPEHKGLLNAITYTGMISSALVWGYLCDTLGRKKLLIAGFLLDGIFVLLAAISQSFPMLLTAKFFGGFIINGPFAAIITYLSEIHCAQQRSRVQMILGVIISFAYLVLPGLSIAILPLNIKAVLSENFENNKQTISIKMQAEDDRERNSFTDVPENNKQTISIKMQAEDDRERNSFTDVPVLHSWNVFLFICSSVPLISGLAFTFLPESPKFLMTIGQNEKALRVFRKIYRINTGKPEDTYPIKTLVNEIELSQDKKYGKVTANRTKLEALAEGLSQMKPLFKPPLLGKILFVCLVCSFTMSSLNTLRLWLPQLFQATNDYKFTHDETAPLCEMLAVFSTKNTTSTVVAEICTVNTNNASVYTNSMIIATVTILGYMVAGILITKLGKKRLYIILSLLSGLSATSLYFSRNMETTLTLASIFTTAGSIMITALTTVIVDMFPTTLRTMTVSMAMICGRCGAIVGNIIFPYLLAAGCLPPFLYVGLLSFGCTLLGFMLPNTELKPLD